MINIIPRLKNLLYYENDILFNQGDQAEEVFFVFSGQIMLYVDIVDFLNMEPFIKSDQSFNLPLSVYVNGSYFGDNEVFLQTNGFRNTTAICQNDSCIYSIKLASLDEVFQTYGHVKQIMINIAVEKHKYYASLRDEIKQKYRSKRD